MLLSPVIKVQGQPLALAESAQKSLSKAGVSVRDAIVEKVAAGRPVADNKDLGKKITFTVGDSKRVEESDLVLWTAGEFLQLPDQQTVHQHHLV
jgi:hypothetical protein